MTSMIRSPPMCWECQAESQIAGANVGIMKLSGTARSNALETPMSTPLPSTLQSDGFVAIPPRVLQEAGIAGGSSVVVEARDQEIVIRAAVPTVEEYTDERKAEFLLNNAVDEADYQSARAEVVKVGLDPDRISHVRPGQRSAGA
jgi:antitoxin component of MazEF toxin-antitoxin module